MLALTGLPSVLRRPKPAFAGSLNACYKTLIGSSSVVSMQPKVTSVIPANTTAIVFED